MDTFMHTVCRTINWTATIVAVLITTALPVGYFISAYKAEESAVRTEADINAHRVTEHLNINPEIWRFEAMRLTELLSRRPRQGHAEKRRIVDTEGRLIAYSFDPLPTPILTRAAPLKDSGVTVGWIEISRSLRGLLIRTGIVGLAALILGLLVFLPLRLLPLRALDRTLRELETTHQSLLKEIEAKQAALLWAERTAADLRESEERLKRQQAAMVKLASSRSVAGGDLSSTLREIVEVVARTLEVERTGVWLYNEDHSQMVCVDLYERSLDRHTSGGELAISNFPECFKAFEEDRVIAAHDAANDERTRGFFASYLSPLGVTSVLDAVIRVHGEALGAVCHEHVGSTREWAIEEQNFAGSIADLVSLAIEASERKRAEIEVQELNERLKQRAIETLKELEAFSYAISHDLSSPLRSIDGFSQLLMEDYEDKIDAQGKNYLHRVRAAAQRMGLLIDSLVELLRVSRVEMSHNTVNLSAMAQSIATQLQNSQPERQVEFVIAPGMVVNGDRHLLGIVLENLLGNAWKFTANQPRARIEFGVTEHEGESAYFVRDNGIGFDMAYAEKLFLAFQRLHPESEFPGNGTGLAAVRRIIYRHKGRVWAEGKMGEGATFYFAL